MDPRVKPGVTAVHAASRKSMMKREDMVGVYRQLGEDAVDAAGKIIYSANNERNSQIMYSPDGYVGVVSGAGRAQEGLGLRQPHRSQRRDRRGARRGDAPA